MKKLYITAIVILGMSGHAQTLTDTSSVQRIRKNIELFLISKGEIENSNQSNFATTEIVDGSDLGMHKKGIYLIRADYRSNGSDYLLYKNGDKFEILDMKNYKTILSKSIELFGDDPDKVLLKYIPELTKWYNDGKVNEHKKVKFVKKQ